MLGSRYVLLDFMNLDMILTNMKSELHNLYGE